MLGQLSLTTRVHILLAVCDAHYRYVLTVYSLTMQGSLQLYLGGAGCHNDAGVFSNSAFGRALEEGTFSLPTSRPLPGTTQPSIPYVIVGDEAFSLNMLRPYPGCYLPGIFNIF